MKITISILPIMVAVLARTSASPVAVDSTSSPVIASETTTTPDIHHSPSPSTATSTATATDEIIVVENPEWTVTISKHKGPKKHKDKKKHECRFDECQACVHRCGELRGFPCIYWRCMPNICKNCNLVIVRPSPHPISPHPPIIA
ncbi:hypothetical protein F4782DRAFT_529011 [Xylaria castorea]|nr:hypothetical protein F4782DRAFT_529011 [Xylaria castorea]